MELTWFDDSNCALSMPDLAKMIEDYISGMHPDIICEKYEILPEMVDDYIKRYYLGASHVKHSKSTLVIRGV